MEPCFEFGGPGLGCGLAGAGLGQSSRIGGRPGGGWLGAAGGGWGIWRRLGGGCWGLLGGGAGGCGLLGAAAEAVGGCWGWELLWAAGLLGCWGCGGCWGLLGAAGGCCGLLGCWAVGAVGAAGGSMAAGWLGRAGWRAGVGLWGSGALGLSWALLGSAMERLCPVLWGWAGRDLVALKRKLVY